MSSEDGKPLGVKSLPEKPAQLKNGDSLVYKKGPLRSFDGCTQQSDFTCREQQPYLSTPIVTTGGSDHSQQETFPLSSDNRLDPFFDELGFSALRQQGWSNPSQHMRSPRTDLGLPRKSGDPLSPGSTHSSHPGGRSGRPPKFDNRQESELQHTPSSSAMRHPHFGSQHQTPRQAYNETMGHSRFSRDPRDGLAGPRNSEEFIGGLSFPTEDALLGGRSTPVGSHRMFEESNLGGEELPGVLPSLDPRGFMQEDEFLFPSAYGSQDGFNRLSMHSDFRGERQMPSPGYMARSAARTRSGGHHTSQALEEPMYSRRMVQGEGSRDPMYTHMGPLHMHRSASEGFIRNPYPNNHSNEPGMHSPEHLSSDHRTRSGSGMQEEISYRPEQHRGLLAARMTETPDFAMIYAFLGSMFDPVCHMIDHADVMNQMNAVDRETTNLILANCVHNLSIPEFAEHVLYHSLRQPGPSNRPRVPTPGNAGFAAGGHARHNPLPH